MTYFLNKNGLTIKKYNLVIFINNIQYIHIYIVSTTLIIILFIITNSYQYFM